ncbi:MAG TPA: helix-turn-helix domain-containing protein [Candidatus Methanomethylicus sp.]|mgnify:FL=1|nr:helix-turn-helix domain-containing protein [Candidatus Methanomethylicus sp.]
MESLLKNPHRRRILELLCTRKAATANELSEELGIGVPAVYYHLELMKGYVQKTARGEFAATEKGLELYRASIEDSLLKASPVSRLVPQPVSSGLKSFKLLPIGAVVAVVEYLACSSMGFRPYIFGYSALAEEQWLPAYYLATVAITFAIFEVVAFALTRRGGGELPLLNGTLIARLPLMLILVPHLYGLGTSPLSLAAFAMGPLISVFMLAFFFALSKGIRPEVSIITCFVLLYFDIFVYMLL